MTRVIQWVRRYWPQRLTSQMIGLVIAALVLAQVANFLIFMDERRAAVRSVQRTQVIERTASLVRLIHHSPPALHNQIVQAASSRKLYFWITRSSPIPSEMPQRHLDLWQRLQGLLGEQKSGDLRLLVQNRGEGLRVRDLLETLEEFPAGNGVSKLTASALSLSEVDDPGLLISVHLQDGRWLNVGMGLNPPLSRWAFPTIISMALAVGSISLIVVLMVKRITRPLGRLAKAAELVGRGEMPSPVLEEGPIDVRQTIRAFNRMYDRLQRFVHDRTKMLAAISHDLRTPITSLRLRAELIEDEETKGKILETLEEMQRMTEATLAFARDEAATEASRTVDLAALVDSLCEDLTDMGMDVTFGGAGKTPFLCRPVSLKRAIRNLIENAVTYGHRARVELRPLSTEFQIQILDDGSGIPEPDYERVFQPFVRLEESRNLATGGIGLGMAIARSIIRKHGGDISLSKGRNGGFCVTVHLPELESAAVSISN